jgi:VWFA-related protein
LSVAVGAKTARERHVMGESHRRSGTPPTLTAGAAIVLLLVGSSVVAHAAPVAASPEESSPTGDRATPVVRVSVELVQVDVAVTDRSGRAVFGLRPEDFEIREDGRLQMVTHLLYVNQSGPAVEPEAPRVTPPMPAGASFGRWLVLVVDDLGMSFEGVARVRMALRKMVETQVEPADRVAVVLTSGSAQAFTSDRRALLGAVESVHWGKGALSTASIRERPRGPVEAMVEMTATTDLEARSALADAARADYVERRSDGALGALRLTLEALLRTPGRKALVLFAEGLDFQTVGPGEIPSQRLELWPLTELANRASTVVYAIDPQGAGGGVGHEVASLPSTADGSQNASGTPAGLMAALSQEPLHDLARDTGGLFMTSNDMVASLGCAADDQRGYYLLGYAPPAAAFESGRHGPRYHRIQVRVRRPGLTVRSRAGYYGVADPPASRASVVDTLQRALDSPLASGQMGLKVTALADADEARRPSVRVFLHVGGDAVKLTDREEGGTQATLEMLLVATDDAGRIAGHAARRFVIPVAAGDESRARREGFMYATTLPVLHAGAYDFRAAIRDASTGHTGSAFTFVDVPDFRAGHLALSGLTVSSDKYVVAGNEAADVLPEVTPAVRVVPRGSSLRFGLRAFGREAPKSTVRPRLATTTELLHDGEVVFTTEEVPIETAVEGAATAIPVGGHLKLPSELEPGSYVVRVVVRDVAAPASSARATQSIDFDLR